jgi:DNA-directed RNA polymerase beta subunit
MFGILASCVPFPEHNQAPRNTYQCAMGKQAIGIYATNFDTRMDKTTYILNYPSRPLVETRVMDFINLDSIPSGTQIHVAIMTHGGYNQEDSVLINKGSIDRGLFLATIYHTEKDEDKNIIRDEIIRCKPDKTKTKGIKYGNYDKLIRIMDSLKKIVLLKIVMLLLQKLFQSKKIVMTLPNSSNMKTKVKHIEQMKNVILIKIIQTGMVMDMILQK